MNCDLTQMKKGGEIHYEINKYIKNIIKPKMKLFDLASIIENRIKDLAEHAKKINALYDANKNK